MEVNQPSICKSFCQHWQMKRAGRLQEREAVEIRRDASFPEGKLYGPPASRKTIVLPKTSRHDHSIKAARYDVPVHHSSTQELKLSLYPAELLNYLSLLLCETVSI